MTKTLDKLLEPKPLPEEKPMKHPSPLALAGVKMSDLDFDIIPRDIECQRFASLYNRSELAREMHSSNLSGKRDDCERPDYLNRSNSSSSPSPATTTGFNGRVALMISGQLSRLIDVTAGSLVVRMVRPFLEKGVDVDVFGFLTGGGKSSLMQIQQDGQTDEERVARWRKELPELIGKISDRECWHGKARLGYLGVLGECAAEDILKRYYGEGFGIPQFCKNMNCGNAFAIRNIIDNIDGLATGNRLLHCLEDHTGMGRYLHTVRTRSDNFLVRGMDAEKLLQCKTDEAMALRCAGFGGGINDRIGLLLLISVA
uniref:Uncharacterized protein n=1 Tax=Chromera velia CCMP2878 TaxID=1169474 RepID=A0A0G4GDH9_9ALVE|eukprot:Cvel_4518.t1-p1 / transcript=Cvel_4518.t1 / gene=Cvel_4518 / organism=Chromera_velia_CCMP2878 / gene_product=hypothetical protein / transcript_product=hypothetical protein / location=Cvel_scaffold198:6757-8952(+) / protein_length=313 / sequence_SO=supercontig / SO=protein_coding / is_pseudo=false